MKIKGIDVSQWQGDIDFNKVKSAGIDFVILRAGYGRYISQKDPYFEQNYARAKSAGLNVGVYWYSYAASEADARTEAAVCMEAIRGKQFEYPIYFDLEEQSQFSRGKAFCSALVTAFCGELEKAGYFAGRARWSGSVCTGGGHIGGDELSGRYEDVRWRHVK